MEVFLDHDYICRARYAKPVLFMLAGWLILLAQQSQAATLNVTNYGAIGDCANITVSVTSNSPVVVTTNQFTSADDGKVICLFQAGHYADLASGPVFGGKYQGTPTNHQDLVATIVSVANGTNVTVSSACGTTANSIRCTYGTQNKTAFDNCIAAAPNPSIIKIPTGNYLLIPPTSLDTNYVQSSQYASSPTITISKGGIHFLGDGTNLTILTGNGAWQQKGLDEAYRGYMFAVQGPITNDGPVIFDGITFNGNAVSNHGPYTYGPAVPTDGSGWDNTHHAFVDTGSAPLWAYRSFTNCFFEHWHGETLYSPGYNWDGMVDVGNCTFYDGNAQAFNMEETHNYHNNVINFYYEVEELDQSWCSNTSYFQFNFITNCQYAGIAVVGAQTNRVQPFYNIVSNNFYSNGHYTLATSPAQNIIFAGNYVNNGSIKLGAAGYQSVGGGCNSNLLFAFNTFTNEQLVLSVEGSYVNSSHDNRTFNVLVVSNSASVSENFAETYAWSTNVSFLYNTGTIGGLNSTGASGQWYLDDISNQFPPYQQADNTGTTNTITYALGMKHQISANVTNSVWVIDDTHPSQVPAGAILQITSTGNYPMPLYASASMSGTAIMLTNGETVNYLWMNGAWVNTASTTNAPPPPPTDLRIISSSP